MLSCSPAAHGHGAGILFGPGAGWQAKTRSPTVEWWKARVAGSPAHGRRGSTRALVPSRRPAIHHPPLCSALHGWLGTSAGTRGGDGRPAGRTATLPFSFFSRWPSTGRRGPWRLERSGRLAVTGKSRPERCRPLSGRRAPRGGTLGDAIGRAAPRRAQFPAGGCDGRS